MQTELYKIFRKGRSYIGFGAIAFIVIVIQIALFVDGESYLELGTQSLKDSFTFQGNLLNGYLSVFIILSSLWVHIPFLIKLPFLVPQILGVKKLRKRKWLKMLRNFWA